MQSGAGSWSTGRHGDGVDGAGGGGVTVWQRHRAVSSTCEADQYDGFSQERGTFYKRPSYLMCPWVWECPEQRREGFSGIPVWGHRVLASERPRQEKGLVLKPGGLGGSQLRSRWGCGWHVIWPLCASVLPIKRHGAFSV